MRNLILGVTAVVIVGAGTQTVQAQRYMRDEGPTYSRSETRDYRRGESPAVRK